MRNSEIDQLKDEMNLAFDEKQKAFDRMKRAGDERFRLKEQLDDSWDDVQDVREEMNVAYEEQQNDWDSYKREREHLSREIDAAKSEAQEAHECMKDCYERANDAWESRDGASAKAYSEDARGYKERRDDFNREASRLIEIAQNMEKPDSQFQYYKTRYDRKMGDHKHLQLQYQRAKDIHGDLKEDFEKAQERFNNARDAFKGAKEAESNMWYDNHCKECSTVIRCRKDWDYPPNYCPDCKEKHKKRKEYERQFGMGGSYEKGGMRPVHAVTSDGKPVTVGINPSGHIFPASGHITAKQFDGGTKTSKGHDHILPNGTYARGGNRGKFKD